MPIYVDNAAIPFKGKPRYHLGSADLAELHAFAASVGINRCWFHRGARQPHYDITEEQRNAALLAGAIEVTSRELVALCRAIRRGPSSG